MASRARWDPLREIAQLQNELSRLVGSAGEREGGGRELIPPADVWETEQEVVYGFDLPGIPEAAITIELENDTLTIAAERERPAGVGEERFHRRERRYGTYSRTIAVPQGTSEEDVSAHSEHGTLEIRIRKQEEPKPRKIQIGVQKSGS
jgi:HSP20 family protein